MVDLHPWSLAELRQTAIASLADAQRPENDLRTRTDLAFDGVYGLCLHFARKKGLQPARDAGFRSKAGVHIEPLNPVDYSLSSC